MKELKIDDYEVEELDENIIKDIDGGWYPPLWVDGDWMYKYVGGIYSRRYVNSPYCPF
jgi:hypothetical protein